MTIRDDSSDEEVEESSEDDDLEEDEENEGLSRIHAQMALAYDLNNFDIKGREVKKCSVMIATVEDLSEA